MVKCELSAKGAKLIYENGEVLEVDNKAGEQSIKYVTLSYPSDSHSFVVSWKCDIPNCNCGITWEENY